MGWARFMKNKFKIRLIIIITLLILFTITTLLLGHHIAKVLFYTILFAGAGAAHLTHYYMVELYEPFKKDK